MTSQTVDINAATTAKETMTKTDESDTLSAGAVVRRDPLALRKMMAKRTTIGSRKKP